MNDVIYRQDAINAILREYNKNDSDFPTDYQLGLSAGRRIIDALPSAQFIEPERKTGTFIGTEYDGFSDGNPVYYEWECSECGCVFEDEEPTYNYCPNCGAKMEGEQ